MRKKRNGKKLRSALAILLAGSMMLGMVPGGMGQVYAADAETSVKEEQTGLLGKAKNFFSDMGEGIADFFTGESAEVEPVAAFDETSVVDKETSQGWRTLVENTTQNIGRIWTDKSVYNSNVTLPGIGEGEDIPITKPEGSDFMVGLSALSSTSNTSVTTSTPLDIVLVLDVSGSMEEDLGTTYEYVYDYDISTGLLSPTYYALDKTGQYVKIEKVMNGWRFDHWELNGAVVEPKTSSNDSNENHIQFYTRRSVTLSKMDGLKNAVNGFIDATAEQNATITDPDKQHHISVVKYADDSYYNNDQDSVGDHTNPSNRNYNYSEIVSKLTGDMASLKSAVNGLDPAGATSADYGMNLANRVLNSSAGHGVRPNAKKVVIMFTDGEPNHSSGFSETVANDAITSAKTLKDAGALVYSIGVVNGANPGDTSNNRLNMYLHGISSNYPAATGYQNLGNRAENSNYYKAATNSEELNNIFKEISEEINTGTGYPTETEDGFANRDGYVTFHDQLGDYMQVDSFNKLILEDITFEKVKKAEVDGVITYTYEGSAGEDKNVSDIVITVTKGTGSMGDTVDVRIPAALLPLRHFKVDVSGNTMTVEDKYPLRLFYNVSLKEDAKKALANPDQEMKNYIAKNKEGGNVYFYSNKFTGSKKGTTQGETLGDTTATFEPATGNSFYYFTENTPLWMDEEMTEPVTSYSAQQGQDIYYYEKAYYKLDNGAPKKVTEAVSFRSHSRDEVEGWVGTATDGQLYIKAGAPRLTRIHDLTSSKEINATETATEVITPNWDDEQAQRNIEVSLGNNGRLAVELPGTLEIKKTVTSEVDAPEKDFTFTLTLKNAKGEVLTGEFDAQKFDAQGVASGNPVKVQNNGTVTLKDGESVKIYGLSNGDTYSIEEAQIPKGFTAKENPIEGTIKGNETVTAAFENTYAVTPVVLEGDSSIRAKKTLTGRDWLDSDSFNIALISIENAPLPEAVGGITIEGNRAIKTVTKGDKDAPDAFDFGKITFTKPGTYTYNIAEPRVSGDAMIPGIDYSGAVYRVDVVVTDNGEGTLSATSTMTQMLDDQGHALGENGSGIEDTDGIAEIINDFNATSVSWGARARKEYIDRSGAYPLSLAKEKFSFKVETVVEDGYQQGPLPGGESSYTVSCGAGGQISFGQATFDSTYVGKKFLYKITEVLPEGVSADMTKDGMTYDATEYYLELSFGSVEDQDGGQIMRVTPKYMKVVDGQRVEVSSEEGVVFTNTYEPTPVVIGDITDTAIKGSKTLNGRAMKENEFSFELTAGNQAAVNGLADDSIKFGIDTESNFMTATAPQADNGEKADFAFGEITFTKPGIYTFNMKEVIPDPKAGGMTYDEHTEVVTVTVTDNNGVLAANTTYDADGAAFVNTYEASHSYSADGGALVTKTLTGRDMKAGEFNFTIEGTGDNKEAADKKLADTDKTFTHYAAKADVPSEMRKLQNVQFTEADAGQTFTYLIKEVIPADKDKAGGVTYDQSEFILAIAVADNGDGTMSTTTTITRTKAADGTDIDDVVVGTYISAEGIVPVPFVNTYKAAPVIVDTSDTTAGPRLRKVLRGRDWKADDNFTFTMTPTDNAPMPADNPEAGITSDGNGGLQAVVTADEGTTAGTRVYFGFGSITYDKAGTYVYTVTENEPESPAGGMTYSKNVVTITVNVTDPGTGKLEAAVNVNGTINNRTFFNDYEASLKHNEAGGIVTEKTLTGHALAEAQFTFQIKALAGDNTTAEENAKRIGITKGTTGEYRNIADTDGDGFVSMKTEDGKDILFTSEDINKTFKYQFSEMGANGEFGAGGTDGGYTYDDTVYTVEFWVTDDLDGTLTLHTKVTDQDDNVISDATSDETDPKETVLAFNNSYAALGELDGEAALKVTKVLDGRKWIDADSFSFKLEATGDTVKAVEDGVVKLPDNASELVITGTDKDHKASFGNIKFTKPGTYTFQVTEAVPEGAENNVLNGITYDSSVKNITVSVTDNSDGTLKVTVAEGSDELTFTNVYKSSTIELNEDEQFKVTKNLVGREWTNEDAFEFTLTAKDGAPMPAEGGNVVTATNAEKTQKFGKITYEAAGTYEYQITETKGNEEDMRYDTHTAVVTVKVAEDFATGTLSVESVTYSDGADGAKFTNVLGKNTKEVTSGNQDVNNGMVGVGDELTYVINWVNDGVDETGAPAAATVKVTDIIPTGTEYVEGSAEGAEYDADARTLTWTIEADAAQTGSVSFKVVVTDNAGGTEIENKGEIKVGENDPKVTNEVETYIPGKDSVVEDGGELQVGSVLTYTISYKNPEAEATTVTITDKIPEGLDYVEGSAGEHAAYDADARTLTWTLENVPAGAKGTVSFKASVNESAVEKVENKATIQIGENNPKYETNTDSKPVPKSGALAISKTIALTEGQGTEIDTEKAFEFTVALTDSKDKALTKEYAYTINNADEKVSDGKVAHNGKLSLKHGETATIIGLPAGTKFTVTETAAAGYTPSPEGGAINGSVTAEKKAKADFTNTYSVTGNLTGAESLKVTKNFTGREGNQWLESDAFTFTLTAADDKATQDAIKAGLITLTDPKEITIDGTMAEKQAAFGNITFNIAGTFKFNVTEQESNIAGVTDDANRVRKIVVNVVDNKDGTLKATIAEGSDNLTFTNTYGAGSGKNDIAAQINATKKLTGRDMQAGEFDFEVVTRKTPEYTGNFTPVVVATGTNAVAAEGAEGGVTFAGYDGNGKMNLVYTTESLNQAVTDGYAIKAVVDGKTVWTVNYTARELTNNLPKGVTSIVEKTAFDFTVVVTDNTDGTLTAEVQYPKGAITFENTYATGGTIVDTDPTDANAFFYKVLEGRDWLETDAFTFTIEPQDGAPAPIDVEGNPVTTVTVTKEDLKDGKAPFGFGKIHFTDANMGTASEKTFMYHVKENDIDAEAMPGVSKDTHTAKFSITLTDDGAGTLSAATPVVTDGIFTNRYESSLDYNAVGGLQISKVLNGRDMQKDQFTFTLTPKATEGSTTAEEAAQKLGFAEVKAYEFKNEAAAMGEATYMNVLSGKEVVFTQADAGKIYTYEIVEVKGQNEAYTYDEAVNIVTITVVDNNNGTLTVTTTVTKNGEVVDTKVVSTGDAKAAPATVPFVNVYNDVPGSLGGEGSVAINATKSLTNRPMADGEFTFHVTDKNGAQVATGNNDASGKITFTPIEYTTDKLNEDAEKGTATKSYDVEKDAYTYTYQYKVEEDLSNVDEGVTGIVTAFSIQVVVTDDGNGNLTIAVVYPDGKDPLPFENAYGTSAEAAIHVNGQKVLNVESGNNAPDITGKYIFTLSGSDGAPMPEKATANNDAAGNVDFGKITYTMQNVFGDTGVTAEAEGTEEALTEVMPVSDTRTKTFTYTVTESGTVEGVTNDAESVKTFNVTVTDNGDGTIKVDKDYTGFEFGFTNTYHVEPVDFDINDAEAGITVKKELTGRAMNAGEFVFELISDKDKSVREAVNDTDGNVKFETMNFTAPGEYIYTLRERNTKLGGVDYDTTEYQVVVTVTDNGDGTMSAEAKLADEGKDIVFKNQYEAAPTSVMFGASKIYKGADLKDGQFTFVVKDADGNVVSEAKNNKDGMVTFDTIEFNEKGTYTFTISEKNDKQKNVTYDKAVYEVTVTVTDNGEGSLIAEVAYADGKAPVFTNKYTKPAEPSKPEEPKKPGAVQTGDSTPIVGLVVAMVVALAAIVAVAVIFFRRRRR